MIKMIVPISPAQHRAMARITPHNDDAKKGCCRDTSPQGGFICVGKPGHSGPHVAHVSRESGCALWMDFKSEEDFHTMEIFLRLME
jgi:hypothetical protein